MDYSRGRASAASVSVGLTTGERLPVIVVGAGLAGLTCARLLRRAQIPVLVIEASDGVGGRVRSHTTPEGFVIDRGFQVLFTAYPALRRAVDLRKLHLRAFDNGAAVVSRGGPVFLRDPLRHPWHAPTVAFSPLLTWSDRARMAGFALRLLAARWDGALDVPDNGLSAEQELRAQGFSEAFIDAFFRPFLAGIRLRRDLSMAAWVARFDLKMLIGGRAALPAHGMQALPDLLAQGLPADALRLQMPVMELVREGRQVRGVRTSEGEVRGSAVVLATDGDTTRYLTGLDVPRVTLGSTTLYLAGRQRLYRDKLLVLNALPDPFVNDTSLLTNVVPEYAPPGWHLLAAHVLESDDLDDASLDARARADLRRLFPHIELGGWRTLEIVRRPRSQFVQLANQRAKLAQVRSGGPGLYLAGEITEDSSINGAIRSGEAAAHAVIADLGRRQDAG